jgi:hypothetical protein
MGVLVHVLPMAKPMSQAVAQVSKTIQSSRWMIASPRALPSVIPVAVTGAVPHLFVVNVPRLSPIGETPEPGAELSARR